MFDMKAFIINKSIFEINSGFKKSFLIAAGFILAFIFPLLTSDHYYADDLVHSMNGETGWVSNGRPLSELVFKLMMANGLYNDISPIPQLIATVSLALAIAILSQKITHCSRLISIMSFLPIAISPYFLENWSYKYDSLPMSMAILFAILPLAIKYEVSNFKKNLASSFFLFISMCFYQAALNLFVSLSVVFFVISVFNGNIKTAIERLGFILPSYFIANILYILTIKKFVIYGDYNIIHGAIVTGSPELILSIAIRNYHLLNDIFLSAFNGTLWVYFSPFIVILPCFIFLTIKKIAAYRGVMLEKILCYLIIITAPFIVYISVFGPMLLLLNPITSARTLIGAAGLICGLLITSSELLRKFKTIKYWITIPIFGLFILAYSLFNAQKTTEKIETSLITRIESDFDSNRMNDIASVSIIGYAPSSFQSKLAEKNFPIIKLLNINNIGQDLLWGELQLTQYYFNKKYTPASEVKDKVCSMKKISSNSLYSLYRNDDLAVINFDNTKCP